MKLTKIAAFFCIAAVVGCSGKTSTPGAGGNSSGDMSSSSGSGSSGGVSSNGGSGSGGSSGSTSGGSGSNGGGGSGSGGTSSSSGSGDDGGTGVTIGADGGIVAPPEVMGCGTTKLYKTSDDLSAAGPWPVGVKTAMLMLSGVSMPVEVWYPATLGSDSGKTQQTYDLRSWLPKGQASLSPIRPTSSRSATATAIVPRYDARSVPGGHLRPWTGSFRVASMSTMTAWASRGFIAVAADHPGLFLTDFLASGNCQGDGTGTTQGAGSLNLADIDNEVTALTNKSGDFAFLGSSVDMSRIGVGGHSQGAAGAASAASRPGVPNVQVDMPLADLGGSVPSGSSLKSALFMGGANDSVVPYSSDTGAYSSTTAKIKRVISIAMGDHLDVTDLCYQTNSQGKTGIQVADEYNVCGTGAPSAALTLLNGLAKCGTVMPPIAGPGIVNYATTAALEETLHCINRDAAFSALKTKYSQVSDFEHTP